MPAVKKFLVSKAKIKQSHDLPSSHWQITQCEDAIVSEEPLEIWLKQQTSCISKPERLIITMRSPGDDINMVTGWLHTSGLVVDSSHIQSVAHTGTGHLKHGTSNQILVTLMPNVQLDFSQHQRLEYVNSSCGVCGQQSIETLLEKLPQTEKSFEPLLKAQQIFPLAAALRHKQAVFTQTGGNHGAGLFLVKPQHTNDPCADLIDVREDVGRHNALDKIIGANLPALLAPKQDCFGVVLSGRVSFELVQKAAMANIRLIIAMGAPSSLAISLAIECDICIVGFVKQHSFNVYSVPEYIQ
ncbi:MAG: FdhD protein [Paraglaciecola sp.]